MKAVVLAAGRGIRLRPLTEKKPKAMVELLGKPMLEWVLESLKKAGIDEVAIIVGYLGEVIEKKFGKNFRGIPLVYLHQKEQLGTANAISFAREFAGNEGFICTYSDVIAESSIFGEIVEKFGEKRKDMFAESAENLQKKFDAVIVGREVRDPWRFGVLKIEGEKVIEIVEKPAIGEEPSNIINAGIYWFSPKIFDEIAKTGKSIRGEYEITDSLREIAKAGRLGLIKYDGRCIDISSIEDLKEAEQLLKGKK